MDTNTALLVRGPCFTFERGAITAGIATADKSARKRSGIPAIGVPIGDIDHNRVFVPYDTDSPPKHQGDLMLEAAVGHTDHGHMRLFHGIETAPWDSVALLKIAASAPGRETAVDGLITHSTARRLVTGKTRHFERTLHEGLYELKIGQKVEVTTTDGIARVLVCSLETNTEGDQRLVVRAYTKDEWI